MSSETITRNDLTAILNEVLPIQDTIEEVNATAVGNYWTNGSIYAIKKGNVVTVKMSGASIAQLTARATIATLPVGFRPYMETSGLIDGTSVWWYIEANGEIRVNATEARTVWGNITYIQAN